MRFVVWIWKGSRDYQPQHVNHLYRQLDRLCHGRFSLVAITDDTTGFLPGVEVIKTPPAALALANLQSPEKQNFPSCYRRLWMLSEEAKRLGERVMLIDVDLVFIRNPSPLFELQHDFVGWRPLRTWGKENRFGGGIYLLRTGTKTHVWDSFKGQASIDRARAAGLRGSDQAWLSYCLAGTEPSWPQNSGIYSIRDLTHSAKNVVARRAMRQTISRNSKPLELPADAIIVQFNGPEKPWTSTARAKYSWLREHGGDFKLIQSGV